MLRAVDERSLGDRAMKAGVWKTTMLVVGKLLGLIRTVALARLLAPDDIGLFAITAVVLSMITRFSNAGLQKAIIQREDDVDVRDYLNTAWTFNLLRVSLLAVGLVLAAPWVAAFFEEPAAAPLVRVLGLGLLAQALASPGLPLLARELEFRRRFVYMTSGVLSDLVISVAFAVVLRNAWALMLGFVGSSVVLLVISYVIVPYWPVLRLELAKLSELVHYGRWVFFNQVLSFLQYRADNLLVGKLFGTTGLGIYVMAYAMSDVAVSQIGTVMTSVAFPTFARAQKDLDKVRRAFLMNIEWVFDVALPGAVVLALCALPLTNLILGELWSDVAVVLPFLAGASSCRALVMVGHALMNGLGRPDLTLRMNLILVGVTYALYYPLVTSMGVRGVGLSLLLGQLGTLPIFVRYVHRIAGIHPLDMLRSLVPGFLLGVGVAIAILASRTGTDPWALLFTLAIAAVVYLTVALMLWHTRKTGPVMILERLRAAYGR